MSNLEKHPIEIVEAPGPDEPAGSVTVLEPRDVPLGGPRAMHVRRTLPQRGRSLIGGWCFVDHYGPEEVAMVVPPHPHTGLQTVSWLFAGEVEHRDSVGSHAMVRPGELNLMTAGRGISHSEVSPPTVGTLHGAQLWVALPEHARNGAPFFERFVPEPITIGAATVHVFIGELAGSRSTARVFSPLVGAQLDIPPLSTVSIDVDPTFEHGVLIDAGDVSVAVGSGVGMPVPASHLGYIETGASILTLSTGDTAARVLLIGGEPLGESIVMWWNFIGRTHEEIVDFREEWQAFIHGIDQGRFSVVPGYRGDALPAPELPAVRLRPRD